MFADTSIQVRSLSNGYYAAYSAVFKHSIELLNLVDQNARIFVKFWRGSSSFFVLNYWSFLIAVQEIRRVSHPLSYGQMAIDDLSGWKLELTSVNQISLPLCCPFLSNNIWTCMAGAFNGNEWTIMNPSGCVTVWQCLVELLACDVI